jgi:hypothetical protein
VVFTTCLRGVSRGGGETAPCGNFSHSVLKTDTSVPLLDTKMREKETKAKENQRQGMRVVG